MGTYTGPVEFKESDEFTCNSQRNILQEIDAAGSKECKKFTLFLSPTKGEPPFNTSNPKYFKQSFISKIQNKNAIDDSFITRNGQLIVTTQDATTAKQVAHVRIILTSVVSTSLQYDCITTKFLLRDIPVDVPLRDIAEELEESNNILVKQLRRFTKFTQDKGKTPTELVLVTVYGHNIPEYIHLFLRRIRISVFYDRPRNCFSCGSWTHSSKVCKKPRCMVCSEGHLTKDCNNINDVSKIKCPNCSGNHKASDNNCPSYLSELQAQKLKTDQHMSISVARRLLREQSKSISFAKVTQSQQITPDKLSADVSKSIIHPLTVALEAILTPFIKKLENVLELVGIQGNSDICSCQSKEKVNGSQGRKEGNTLKSKAERSTKNDGPSHQRKKHKKQDFKALKSMVVNAIGKKQLQVKHLNLEDDESVEMDENEDLLHEDLDPGIQK